ncbi:MAG: acyl-CoA dehydrogenase [Chloroflexaceae bacterium]|nr:acyl-CoA dehydrogenase [Chloroflexaceae bacterium]
MTDDFTPWIGKTETVEDTISLAHALAVAATFDLPGTAVAREQPLPPLWQWFYFLPRAAQSQLDVDGHPQRGGFMPPIPYPRRMFAGSRLTIHQPLRIDKAARREGVIRNIVQKSGKSGPLAFVTVGYRFVQDGQLCIEEEQDIVYREAGDPVPAPVPVDLPSLPEGAWSQTIVPDTRLLFRFSAITFNSHRIHYDRPYAMQEEGYPGLVVHGPLTATLLLHLVRQHTARPVRAFRFQGKAPLFDLAPFRLVGIPTENEVTLEAQAPDGKTAMTALASF